MKIAAVVAAVGLSVCTSACATVIRGSSQNFLVKTEPTGAAVKLSTGETCEATPCTFRRSRKEAFAVTVSKPGYETQVIDIKHHWSAAGTTTGVIGNAILGGGIGIGVDAATGANQDLDPNPLVVAMKPVAPASAAPAVAAAPNAIEPASLAAPVQAAVNGPAS